MHIIGLAVFVIDPYVHPCWLKKIITIRPITPLVYFANIFGRSFIIYVHPEFLCACIAFSVIF